MDGVKTLSIEGLINNSSKLNNVSLQISEICESMHSEITKLRENGAFQTVQGASDQYFANIEQLQGNVPKFTEAILKFSKFLSEYVKNSYADIDEESRQKIEANLGDAISKLDAMGVSTGGSATANTSGGASQSGSAAVETSQSTPSTSNTQTVSSDTAQNIDYTKISTSAQGALQGNFVNSNSVHKEAFADGNLEFVTRPDGSVQIVKDGTVMGYTTQEGLSSNQTSAMQNDPRYQQNTNSTPSTTSTIDSESVATANQASAMQNDPRYQAANNTSFSENSTGEVKSALTSMGVSGKTFPSGSSTSTSNTQPVGNQGQIPEGVSGPFSQTSIQNDRRYQATSNAANNTSFSENSTGEIKSALTSMGVSGKTFSSVGSTSTSNTQPVENQGQIPEGASGSFSSGDDIITGNKIEEYTASEDILTGNYIEEHME